MTQEVERLPVPRTAASVHKEMTKPLQVICDKLKERMVKLNNNGVLTYYDLGTNVNEVLQSIESGDLSYGAKPIEQMAIYFDQTTTTLYNARTLANTFTREFVLKKTEEAAKRSMALTYNHWLSLSKIGSETQRMEMLASCIKQRWSHSMLASEASHSDSRVQHHRSGGKKPGVPQKPMQALSKFHKLCNTLNKYGEAADDTINNGLLDIPPDELNPFMIEELDKSITAAEELQSTANAYYASLTDIRVKLGKAVKGYKSDDKEPAKSTPREPAKVAPKQVAAKVAPKAAAKGKTAVRR